MSVIDIRTATITSKGQIVIPSTMRKGLFEVGNKVVIIAKKDRIEIRPLEDFEESMEMALASEKALAEVWDTPEEDEAWSYLQTKK
ncbi:AbrB/MazE/SpoVT family DNA-binding domain-containing protein [Methanolobus profundi]|uniref:Looped-hinge helix DNA binding domain-containing protein, AbrB family n=1 Tax=Methanolobus profundi TaxID=487685 RepID=A0A1I4RBI8_9EURY|nr:AbrB/MazE/SpoVT family DNA-binding domain-containing protein [Methanolobus profundi]SFM49642.1 looped-hinge helix DNA binding domain-containing protein, AbrB family [Methanolobus profundi]